MQDKLTHPMSVNFSKEQLQTIRQAALDAGLKPSEFVRHHALVAADYCNCKNKNDIFTKIWGEDAPAARALFSKIFDIGENL